MIGGTISLTIPKLKNMEEGLVSPHWLVTTRITPSFPFSKTNLQTSSPWFLCWVFQIFWTKFILNSSLPWQSCSKLFHQDLHCTFQFVDIVLLKMLAKRLHPFLFVLSSKSVLKSWKSMPLNWAEFLSFVCTDFEGYSKEPNKLVLVADPTGCQGVANRQKGKKG